MGLAEILNQPTRPTGMVSGYMSGLESGTNLAATNAQTAQQGLASQRYAAETPDYLKKQQIANETSRLANLPGQANEQAGVYPEQAQSNLQEARQKAAQAKAAMETLPAETQAKLHSEINKGTAAFLEQVATTLKQTGSVAQTIQSIEQSTPKVTQDPGWQAEKQKIMKMNPQQAVAFVDQMRAKIASSNTYADEKQQGKMISTDQEHTNRMVEIDALARNRENIAKLKPIASGGHQNQNERLAELFAIYHDNNRSAEERNAAATEINMRLRAGDVTQQSNLAPELGSVKSTPSLPPVQSRQTPTPQASPRQVIKLD